MSNLNQLANRAQRKAEQAERTAGRHQDRVDLWQRHVDSRPPGSAARSRAERQLRHNTKLRDRALERARQQRNREADYRRRAQAQPPAKARPPRRRWQPQGPLGKAVAVTLLSAGAVTGIAIGGADGFDPLDAQSQIVVEIPDAAPDANGGAGQNNRNAPGNGGTGSADTESGNTKTPNGTTNEADTGDQESPVDDETSTPPTSDTPTPDAKTPTIPKTPATPKVNDSLSRTSPPDTAVATTPAPAEPAPSQADLDAAEFDDAITACVSLVEQYPDIESLFIESCFVDPWGTIGAIDIYLAEIHDAEEAVGAAVDNCLWTLESYPELAELDPALAEDCHQDPEGTVVVIAQLGEEMAARAETAALVDECYAQLDLSPELVEIDSGLVGRCSIDPASALTTINKLLDFAG